MNEVPRNVTNTPTQSDSPPEPISERPGANAPRGATTARLRRRMLPMIYVVLLAAGVLGAWRVHAWRSGGGGGDSPGPIADRRSGMSAELPSWDDRGWSQDPLAGVGLEDLGGDPAGLAPPAGARRLWAFGRAVDAEGSDQQATYEWEGSVSQGAAHYVAAAGRAGFAVLHDAEAPGMRRLVLSRGGLRASVRLRAPRENETMVSISVTVLRGLE